jgi:hypothetical protein
MAKAKRKQKLKVFRTPIGFHDAYVAAPSQKAALEAWGVDTNLFARGEAEQVSEPELAKLPLEHPGQVVKVARGTKEEQLRALAKQAEVVPKRANKSGAKPNRSALAKAEEALDQLEKRQAEQLEELERRRRDLQRRHERERDEAQERIDGETAKYEKAVRRYESG